VLTDVSDEILITFEKYFKLEYATFKQILVDKAGIDSWDIYNKEGGNYTQHQNLGNFLNAMVSFQLKNKIKNQTVFTKLVDKFLEYSIASFSTLTELIPSVAKKF
jgi:hypothetical protein